MQQKIVATIEKDESGEFCRMYALAKHGPCQGLSKDETKCKIFEDAPLFSNGEFGFKKIKRCKACIDAEAEYKEMQKRLKDAIEQDYCTICGSTLGEKQALRGDGVDWKGYTSEEENKLGLSIKQPCYIVYYYEANKDRKEHIFPHPEDAISFYNSIEHKWPQILKESRVLLIPEGGE